MSGSLLPEIVPAVDAANDPELSEPHAGFSSEDAAWMRRALELAERGRYTSRPNPCVGTVLVRGGELVGEGWHQHAGGRPHAETWALDAAGKRARGATAYVTLEPCCFTGRTGPCTDRLIEAGVARVVAAARDPNPLVDGTGFQRLREAGIQTEVGLMEAAANALNAGFVQRMQTGRPRVTLKLAASLDGRTAMADGASRWITGTAARRDVHRLRARAGAVLTGIGTVLADDPSLTVRDASPEELLPPGTQAPRFSQPLRAVLDSSQRLPASAKLLHDGQGDVLLFSREPAAAPGPAARVLAAPGDDGRIDLGSVLDTLGEHEINDVLVECGPTLAGAFLQARLVDEMVVYVAPKLLGQEARPLVHLPGLALLADAPRFELRDAVTLGEDVRMRLGPASA